MIIIKLEIHLVPMIIVFILAILIVVIIIRIVDSMIIEIILQILIVVINFRIFDSMIILIVLIFDLWGSLRAVAIIEIINIIIIIRNII